MTVPTRLDPIDIRVTSWMARHGITLTRLALGVVFLWFGIIKFVPEMMPLILFPAETFRAERQHIIKNLVLVSAAIVIGATVRGGRLRATPP